MSESNQVEITYVKETVYGETPAVATWDTARLTSEQFTATPTTTVSSEIRTDRMTSDMPKVGLTVSGGLDIEFSEDTYDTFLASAFANDWVDNTTDKVLTIGASDSSYSFQKYFKDVDSYILFSGMRVDTLSMEIAYGSILTGAITFAGNGATTSQDTPPVAQDTVNAPTTTNVLNASSDVGNVSFTGGGATGICISSLSFEIANNLREKTCVGSDAPTDQMKGEATVTGSVEVYLTKSTFALYQSILDNTDMALSFTVGNYTFEFPRVKLSGEAPQAGGGNQDVMVSADFTALVDDVTGTSVKITKATP